MHATNLGLVAGVGVITAIGFIATAVTSAAPATPATPATPAAKAAGNLGATVQSITELRQRTIVEQEDSFSMQQPGIEVSLGLNVPAAMTLINVARDPEQTLTATDSNGTDLTQLVSEYSDTPEFAELNMSWNGPPTSFTLKLSPASRTAKTFSVQGTFIATMYEALTTHEATLGTNWTALDSSIFDGTDVSARFVRNGRQVTVEFKPGNVYRQIETAELIGETTVESDMAMWNDQAATVYFNSDALGATTSPTLKLSVRTGYTTVPFIVSLQNEQLP
ncbi:MAG: hypothetical protein KC983_12245 [Phycisphaerales bacterium]|nr:hypothetical protein [Phycisphaerales bacterium]